MSYWDEALRFGSYASLFVPGLNVAAPLIIGGANAVADRMNANEATGQAQQQLTQANTQSRDVLNQGTQQALGAFNSAYAPYLALGGQAANTLGGLMGFSMPSSPMPTAGGMGTLGSLGTLGATETPKPTRTRPDDAPVTGQAFPRGTYAANQAEAAQAQTATSFNKVRMRAPNGEEDDVPESAVQHFLQLGGTVVS